MIEKTNLLEKVILYVLGNPIKREKVEWMGIKTNEGKNEFLDLVCKTYPSAEKIYQQRRGIGCPTPTCLLEYL
jgi:hypothetical protein